MGKKLTYDYVKEQIEIEGYKLLSNEYVNNKSKLTIQCPKGHISEISMRNFQQGSRCSVCYNLSKRLTYESVKEQIQSVEGYKLLSDNYIGNKLILKIKCDKGHTFSTMSFNSFQQGQRCPICNGNVKLTYDHVKYQIESFGYKLLSEEYKNSHTKLKIKCDKGHEYNVKWNDFQQGYRCPICWNESKSSKSEREIQKMVNKIYPKSISNDRTQILNTITGKYLELDIYIPELQKAIEYNGTYWHSFPEKIQRDRFKIEECKRLGIELLIIEEQNYMNSKQTELNKIRDFINE